MGVYLSNFLLGIAWTLPMLSSTFYVLLSLQVVTMRKPARTLAIVAATTIVKALPRNFT